MGNIIIIESPFAGGVAANVEYARECMHHSLLLGEAPYASHLLYTQPGVLDDDVQEERTLGIEAGFAFKHIPDSLTVFYIDLGWSNGMLLAREYCKRNNLPFISRLIRG